MTRNPDTIRPKLLDSLQQLLYIFAFMFKIQQNFIEQFEEAQTKLEQFVEKFSKTFSDNIQTFNVNGSLSLKLWSDKIMCQKILAEMHQHGSDIAYLQLGDFESTFQRFVRELSLDDIEQLENKMSS